MVTKALLVSLLTWIGSHTSYDVSHVSIPQVEYHTKEEIQKIYYGNCRKSDSNEIIAVYWSDTMYLNKDINPRKKDSKAIIVHELTHHLQSVWSGQAPQAYEEREKEAVVVENAWRKDHGLSEVRRPTTSQAPSCEGE